MSMTKKKKGKIMQKTKPRIVLEPENFIIDAFKRFAKYRITSRVDIFREMFFDALQKYIHCPFCYEIRMTKAEFENEIGIKKHKFECKHCNRAYKYSYDLETTIDFYALGEKSNENI